jgi:LemA protein
MNTLTIVIGILIIFLIYLIGVYNSLVILKTRIKEALSGIDVQLKRRADLIPNLVETVKGYAKHEKTVFENVTKARSALLKAENLKEKAQANEQLSSALKTLFAVAEAYPQLQASENFRELQRQLEDTEDKIAYSRQFYNANVLDYNTKVKMFPSNIIAGFFGFKEEEFFQTEEEERKNVKVKFD